MRDSPFSDAIRDELGSGGLELPQLECLDQADNYLISSPSLLITANGSFPAVKVREQATKQGFWPASYKGVNLWINPKKSALSIAQMSDQVLLLGLRKTLETTIDRTVETNAKASEAERETVRKYSPLLARAARVAHKAGLWVVAAHLPDPLANRFVPFDVTATAFEGDVTLDGGLRLEAWITATSPNAAMITAERLRGNISALPALAQGIQIQVDGDQVLLGLAATNEQVSQSLRSAPAPLPAAPVVVAEAHVEEPKLAEPKKPMVIRIVGLDEGPREIPFPDPPAL